MKKVILMVGNIGSGKSTLVNITKKSNRYIIVSRDSIRYGIGGGDYIFDTHYEPTVWKIEKYAYEQFLKLGVDIIVDETNVTKRLRAEYIKLAKQYGYDVIVHEMPRLSKEESVDRRMTNPHGQPDRTVWEKVWEMFDSAYESPTVEEGIDNIFVWNEE